MQTDVSINDLAIEFDRLFADTPLVCEGIAGHRGFEHDDGVTCGLGHYVEGTGEPFLTLAVTDVPCAVEALRQMRSATRLREVLERLLAAGVPYEVA